MTALLEISGISRSFGGVAAVSDVHLSVPEGCLAAVIGPNGAGKTTLFNVIAGVLAPSAGSIRFAGQPVDDVPMHRRVRLGISRTFQNLRLVPDLTVLENVLLGSDALMPGGLLGDVLDFSFGRGPARAARARAQEFLELVGLAGRAADPAGGLAYGEGKLLELARALAASPRLVLLDEPAAGLPHAEAEQMAALIRTLPARGTTVLLVEHNMRLVMSVAERILVMAGGRTIAEGTPAEIGADQAVIEAYLGREEDA
ncbi:MAG: ABC transporter ATP-binding protein [Rhodospirillales bacterium]|nr:ABC transporter ATP-binding protein [Rhodospirillales bacterium]